MESFNQESRGHTALLSVAEVAEIVGASKLQIRRAVRRGQLQAIQCAEGHMRIAREALDDFIPPHIQILMREFHLLFQPATTLRRWKALKKKEEIRQTEASCRRGRLDIRETVRGQRAFAPACPI